MRKIVQIMWSDMQFHTVEEAKALGLGGRVHNVLPDGRYKDVKDAYKEYSARHVLLLDAPINIHFDYAFNPSLDGDARFIIPTAPEGWELDEGSGTFRNLYQEREQERMALYTRLDGETVNLLRKLNLGLEKNNDVKLRLKELHDYHEAVRSTQGQKDYPHFVQYPEYPERKS
jgi:hypothetical protein